MTLRGSAAAHPDTNIAAWEIHRGRGIADRVLGEFFRSFGWGPGAAGRRRTWLLMHLWPQGKSDYIGYVHPCIPALKVTWIEATIAAPVFSGLVTYYVEGGPSQRRNLMDTRLGGAERSYKVRGNLFSFLLPWEDVIRQLSDKCEEGDLSEWPWSPEA